MVNAADRFFRNVGIGVKNSLTKGRGVDRAEAGMNIASIGILVVGFALAPFTGGTSIAAAMVASTAISATSSSTALIQGGIDFKKNKGLGRQEMIGGAIGLGLSALDVGSMAAGAKGAMTASKALGGAGLVAGLGMGGYQVGEGVKNKNDMQISFGVLGLGMGLVGGAGMMRGGGGSKNVSADDTTTSPTVGIASKHTGSSDAPAGVGAGAGGHAEDTPTSIENPVIGIASKHSEPSTNATVVKIASKHTVDADASAEQSKTIFESKHPGKFVGDKPPRDFTCLGDAFEIARLCKDGKLNDFDANKLEIIEAFTCSKRFIIKMRYEGKEFYFYKSSGLAGKKNVRAGEFYFTAGILERFVKLPDVLEDKYNPLSKGTFETQMQNHGGLPFFQQLASHLNRIYT